jgi:hypothetical protein
MLFKRLNQGVLKKYNDLYRNPWFFIIKKVIDTYYLINAIIKIKFIIL